MPMGYWGDMKDDDEGMGAPPPVSAPQIVFPSDARPEGGVFYGASVGPERPLCEHCEGEHEGSACPITYPGAGGQKEPACMSSFEGVRCAYGLHPGTCPHWAITPSGEVTWTEQSLALREVAAQLKRLADGVEALAEQAARGELSLSGNRKGYGG
jgi:hypothetical protein